MTAETMAAMELVQVCISTESPQSGRLWTSPNRKCRRARITITSVVIIIGGLVAGLVVLGLVTDCLSFGGGIHGGPTTSTGLVVVRVAEEGSGARGRPPSFPPMEEAKPRIISAETLDSLLPSLTAARTGTSIRSSSGEAEPQERIERRHLLAEKEWPEKQDGYGYSCTGTEQASTSRNNNNDSNNGGYGYGNGTGNGDGRPRPCRGYNNDDNTSTSSSNAPVSLYDSMSDQDEEAEAQAPAVVFEEVAMQITEPPILTPPPDERPTQAPTEAPQQTSPSTDVGYEEESLIANIVRIGVSIALPPLLERGMPRKVARAVTTLLNISAALRSDELLNKFLPHYDEALESSSSTESMVATLLNIANDQNDIPVIIPIEQQLLFFFQYQNKFHLNHPGHAYFWEMVHKSTHGKPVHRDSVSNSEPVATLPPSQATTTTTINTTTTTTTTNANITSNTATTTTTLGTWWFHEVAYRCYWRDEYGQVHPLLDADQLELIEHQMQLWLSYHVNVTNELFEKINGRVVGVAIPGEEYDVPVQWMPTIQQPPENYGDNTDDFIFPQPEEQEEGTYTEPLITPGEGLVVLETSRQLLGLISLSSTVVIVIVWILLALVHRGRKAEQAVWGSNVGTEQALQELLSVGWRMYDEAATGDDAGPRQILEIYDKTNYGMGYRDDDSLLRGGVGPPWCNNTNDF